MKIGPSFKAVFLVVSALLGAGCSGGGGNGSATGTVSVSLMDRPVDDVTALFVTITDIHIKSQGGGPAIELPLTTAPMTVDLLSLTADSAALLVDGAVVEAGEYNWIEFGIDDSDLTKSYAITNAGGQVTIEIDVPSDKIRLVSGFTVGDNQAVQFLFDWEVGKGLTHAVGRGVYVLKPAFRVLRVEELGSISGRLTSATATGDAVCSTVADPLAGKVAYFFAGAVTADDTDGIAPEPTTTVDATFDPASGDYLYRTVLMPGDYTAAFTCLGDLDTEDGDEDLMFLAPLGDGGSVFNVTTGSAIEDVDF